MYQPSHIHIEHHYYPMDPKSRVTEFIAKFNGRRLNRETLSEVVAFRLNLPAARLRTADECRAWEMSVTVADFIRTHLQPR